MTTAMFKEPYPPSFSARPPTTSTQAPTPALYKQRRVSLAGPSSERLVPAWDFRDDTSVEKHVAEHELDSPEDVEGNAEAIGGPSTSSSVANSSRGKSRSRPGAAVTAGGMSLPSGLLAQSSGQEEDRKPSPEADGKEREKKVRRKWTMEETNALVEGCKIVSHYVHMYVRQAYSLHDSFLVRGRQLESHAQRHNSKL
jgi:hypothetical protein